MIRSETTELHPEVRHIAAHYSGSCGIVIDMGDVSRYGNDKRIIKQLTVCNYN